MIDTVNEVPADLAITADRWPLFRGSHWPPAWPFVNCPSNLSSLWQFRADGAFEATAVIVDGVVYVGSLDGYLYAITLESGELKWKFKTDLGFYAAAAVPG